MAGFPKIVVSGDIGSGKSTVVRAAMKQLGWTAPGGFFTHWNGKKRGAERLLLETWTGERCVLARRLAGETGDPDRPPYELDRPAAARAAAACLPVAGAERPVVIDELGPIEFAAPEFAEALARLFRGPAPVLAVVQRRALERWLDVLGRDRVTQVLEVDSAARDELPGRIAALFRAGFQAS